MRARKIASAPMRGLKSLTSMVFRRHTWRMWRLPGSRLDWARMVGDGTGSSTVMAPVLWIARTFPEAPPMIWTVDDAGEEEPQPKHPLLRILTRPNEYYSGAVLWMATVIDYFVDGNAYWLKVRNNAGAVTELWWVPAFMICPYSDDPAVFIEYYRYTPDGQPIRIEIEDVVHFRYGLDPDDNKRGLSPLRSVLREVFTDDEAANFTAALLRNMGVPGVVVSPKGDVQPGPDDVAAVKTYVHDAFTGDKRGEPLVFSGPTDVHQFGFNPQQMDLKALRRIPEERVSAVLGIPAIVAGLGAGLDRSTFANYAEAREAAYESNIIPAQRILAEDIRFQLLDDFEDEAKLWDFRVGFDLSGVRVLQEDRDALVIRLSAGVTAGWIKVAEARRQLDLEVGPEDEIYLRGLSVVERNPEESRIVTGEPPPAPPPALPPGPPPDPTEPPADEPPPEPKRKALSAGQRAGLVTMLANDVTMLTDTLTAELERDFEQLGKLAADAYLTVADKSRKDAIIDAEPSTATITPEMLADRILAQLATSAWTAENMRDRIGGAWLRTASRTVGTINEALNLGVTIADAQQAALRHTGATRTHLLDIDGDTRSALIRAISDGTDAGENPRTVARRVRSEVPAGRYVNAGPKYRAELIARTETMTAQRMASIAAYRNADVVTAVQALDGDSDPDCAARNGRTFTFEQADAESTREHPNGTLTWTPVVGD